MFCLQQLFFLDVLLVHTPDSCFSLFLLRCVVFRCLSCFAKVYSMSNTVATIAIAPSSETPHKLKQQLQESFEGTRKNHEKTDHTIRLDLQDIVAYILGGPSWLVGVSACDDQFAAFCCYQAAPLGFRASATQARQSRFAILINWGDGQLQSSCNMYSPLGYIVQIVQLARIIYLKERPQPLNRPLVDHRHVKLIPCGCSNRTGALIVTDEEMLSKAIVHRMVTSSAPS